FFLINFSYISILFASDKNLIFPDKLGVLVEQNLNNKVINKSNLGDSKQPATYHIALVTGMTTQGAEDTLAAQEIIKRYGLVEEGGLIHYITYPDDYIDKPEEITSLIGALGDDPLLKVIVVNQALGGTADGFKKVKEKRSEIICLAGVPHEQASIIAETSDLVVDGDFISRGYLLPYVAKQLGAKNIVHISFDRHMKYDSILLRSLIMEKAAKNLDLNFFYETAIDPVIAGEDVAIESINKNTSLWLQQYGSQTAFFATNDSHVAPLIQQLSKQGQGIFLESDLPTPLVGFASAFNVDLESIMGKWNEIINKLDGAIKKLGGENRFVTWAYPLSFSLSTGLVEFGVQIAENKVKVSDIQALLKCLGVFSPLVRWNGTFLTDYYTGKPYRNFFIVFQDSYVFGRGFIETTKVDIPDEFFSITLPETSQ
ncbi:MAG: DUF3798 domain-containing protein, partial [Deltaproteobacteria bacterium]|nr:DUF3798 domain-containing protein [Deltaproteobacteria bacterium]